MPEENNKLTQGIFQGRVLEALDNLKKANAENTLEHRRMFKRLDELTDELATRKADSRVDAAKISGIIVGIGVVIQGALWWTG